MAYVDPQFNVAQTLAHVVTGTATASATNGVAVTQQLFKTIRAVKVNAIRVLVDVVPKTGSMGLVYTVKAGTNTVGVVTMSTNTAAASSADGVLTSSNTNVAADTVLSVVVSGTATASADTIGSAVVEIDHTPLFS